ncbi:5695_t:CDS:2, partial [Entrophospora sp. SA101]
PRPVPASRDEDFAPGRPPEACRDEAESLRSRTCALWQGFDGALSPLWTALGQLIVTEAFETSVANGFGNSTLAGTLGADKHDVTTLAGSLSVGWSPDRQWLPERRSQA